MILASHQPYFFPYVGYYSLIFAADLFVFADDRQYTRKGWMARNRILKPGRNEDQYIRVGLIKPHYQANLMDCKLHPDESWKIKIFDQVAHYKKNATHYQATKKLLELIFEKKYSRLVDFNIESTKVLMETFEIKTKTLLFSNFSEQIEKTSEPGLWGLNTCVALNASAYINAPDGESFIPAEEYKNANIRLGFVQPHINPYHQKNNSFIDRLSVIDVLMFNGIEKTAELIKNDFHIKWKN